MSRESTTLTPYVGLGYLRQRTTEVSSDVIKYSSPAAALGAIVGRSAPQWSIGFDGALLILFSGKTVEYYGDYSDTYKHGVGWGVRFQVPFTYNITKKENSTGIMAFATPSYIYINTGKSNTLTWEAGTVMESWSVKTGLNLLAIKVGVGFAF
jgi:hypothetical protein